MAEVRQCRATEILQLGGRVYAFDSSTIDLCLSVFGWSLFRKKKGGIKLHTMYDIETQIPTFFHITPARIYDTRAMDAIPYEENSFYIFDRAYNDFGRPFSIDGVEAYFVVSGKKNNDFKPMRWKRRLPAGVISYAVGYMGGQLTMSKYPEKIRRILYLDRSPAGLHLLHKCAGYKLAEGSRTIAQQVADRTVLQMDATTPEG